MLALSAPRSGLPAATRAALAAEIPSLRAAVAKVPRTPEGDKPVTLGIGEPFTTTITVTLLFALVISLPVILFELYGFVLPAFSPSERRIAMPLLISIPFLFVIGRRVRLLRRAARGAAVLPELQQQRVQRPRPGRPVLQIRRDDPARDGPGLPGARRDPRGATRVGIVTPKQLRHNRRYAVWPARGGGVPAGRRGDAGAGDGAAVHPLRAQHPRRLDRRSPRRQTRAGEEAAAAGGGPAPGGCLRSRGRRSDRAYALLAAGPPGRPPRLPLRWTRARAPVASGALEMSPAAARLRLVRRSPAPTTAWSRT